MWWKFSPAKVSTYRYGIILSSWYTVRYYSFQYYNTSPGSYISYNTIKFVSVHICVCMCICFVTLRNANFLCCVLYSTGNIVSPASLHIHIASPPPLIFYIPSNNHIESFSLAHSFPSSTLPPCHKFLTILTFFLSFFASFFPFLPLSPPWSRMQGWPVRTLVCVNQRLLLCHQNAKWLYPNRASAICAT